MKLRLRIRIGRKGLLIGLPIVMLTILIGLAITFNLVAVPFLAATDSAHDRPSEGHVEVSTENKITHGKEMRVEGGGNHAAVQHEAVLSEADIAKINQRIERLRSPLLSAVRLFIDAQSAAAQGVVVSQTEAMRLVLGELERLDPKAVSALELDALAVFIFSGGDPVRARRLLDQVKDHPSKRRVLEGAINFAFAKQSEAARLLENHVDPLKHSAALASRIYLAKAALATKQDFAAQRKFLQLAATLGSGTLVEEAALRRLVNLSLASNDSRLFSRSARRYARRFSNSLYAGEFHQNVVKAAIYFERRGLKLSDGLLHTILSRMKTNSAATLILAIADNASKIGAIQLCRRVTEGRFLDYLEDDVDKSRAKLYQLACDVLDKPGDVLLEASLIEKSHLRQQERLLLDDAMRLADSLVGTKSSTRYDGFVGPENADNITGQLKVSVAQQILDTNEALNESLR